MAMMAPFFRPDPNRQGPIESTWRFLENLARQASIAGDTGFEPYEPSRFTRAVDPALNRLFDSDPGIGPQPMIVSSPGSAARLAARWSGLGAAGSTPAGLVAGAESGVEAARRPMLELMARMEEQGVPRQALLRQLGASAEGRAARDLWEGAARLRANTGSVAREARGLGVPVSEVIGPEIEQQILARRDPVMAAGAAADRAAGAQAGALAPPGIGDELRASRAYLDAGAARAAPPPPQTVPRYQPQVDPKLMQEAAAQRAARLRELEASPMRGVPDAAPPPPATQGAPATRPTSGPGAVMMGDPTYFETSAYAAGDPIRPPAEPGRVSVTSVTPGGVEGKVAEFLKANPGAKVSDVQREFKMAYNRAARIVGDYRAGGYQTQTASQRALSGGVQPTPATVLTPDEYQAAAREASGSPNLPSTPPAAPAGASAIEDAAVARKIAENEARIRGLQARLRGEIVPPEPSVNPVEVMKERAAKRKATLGEGAELREKARADAAKRAADEAAAARKAKSKAPTIDERIAANEAKMQELMAKLGGQQPPPVQGPPVQPTALRPELAGWEYLGPNSQNEGASHIFRLRGGAGQADRRILVPGATGYAERGTPEWDRIWNALSDQLQPPAAPNPLAGLEALRADNAAAGAKVPTPRRPAAKAAAPAQPTQYPEASPIRQAVEKRASLGTTEAGGEVFNRTGGGGYSHKSGAKIARTDTGFEVTFADGTKKQVKYLSEAGLAIKAKGKGK